MSAAFCSVHAESIQVSRDLLPSDTGKIPRTSEHSYADGSEE
jgi:hypothetical protein